jgi:serine/threonine protein kinase
VQIYDIGVVHHDVKPGTMLVGPGGVAKLMDFGISKVREAGREGLTQAKGTPQYMAPEQILAPELDQVGERLRSCCSLRMSRARSRPRTPSTRRCARSPDGVRGGRGEGTEIRADVGSSRLASVS